VTTQKPHSAYLEILYPFLIVIFVTAAILYAQKSFFFSLITVLGFIMLVSLFISRYKLQHYFLMILAFLLPLSVELPISDTVKIFIPGEPMLAIAIFTLGWDILRKPSRLLDLFSRESKWTIPLLFSFLFAAVSSTMVVVSVKFAVINLSYILVFFLWQKLLFKGRPEFFPKLLILFSLSHLLVLAFSLFHLAEYEWNPVTIKAIFRPFYKDHTIFGAASAFLSAFWFLYATKANPSKLRLLMLVLGILFLGGVFLSFSRAAFLSFVFFVLVWLALQLKVRVKHIVLAVLLGIMLIGFYQQQLLRRLYSNQLISRDPSLSYVERIESSGNISTDISNLERLNRWYSGIKMAIEKPLTGFGPGTYQFEYIPYQNPKLMNRLTVRNYWHIPENSGGTAHSEYILALSEMGFVGFTALLILLGRWFWIAFEKVRSHPQRKNILIAFAVLSTYLFHGAFNNFLTTDKFAFLFWGFAAWMAANYELKTPDS
jgi:putative inorganic carbon (hco3(-)) transporter